MNQLDNAIPAGWEVKSHKPISDEIEEYTCVSGSYKFFKNLLCVIFTFGIALASKDVREALWGKKVVYLPSDSYPPSVLKTKLISTKSFGQNGKSEEKSIQGLLLKKEEAKPMGQNDESGETLPPLENKEDSAILPKNNERDDTLAQVNDTASTQQPILPLLTAVPKNPIKMGLPNNGNTCWMNAMLKFIACTDFYDQMLIESVPADAQNLQGKLRTLINELRSGKEGVLSKEIYNDFIDEVGKVPGIRLMNQFQVGVTDDASDFLMSLMRVFDCSLLKTGNHPNLPRKFSVYESQVSPDVKKYSREESHIDPFIAVNFSWENDPQALDTFNLGFELAPLLEDRSRAEVNPDIGSGNQFIQRKLFSYLPPTLMLYLKRGAALHANGQYVTDAQGRIIETKIEGAVLTDANNLIKLTEYEVAYNDQGEEIILPKRHCYYRIGASVKHDSNHYTCEEITAEKKMIHSDTSVREADPNEEFGTKGTFLRLDRVPELDEILDSEKLPVQPSQSA
jgi:hypothetical protein